ncbi:aldose 1-epimerase family protein [Rhodobacter lacus]|uniref:Aldose 1-epimerase family protein n=1 Tax=Rhodobacter lacus TaxID=1641972 RepID=A0ABW5A9N1_9RHOB
MRIGTDQLTVEVAARGAETRSIRYRGAEILWQGDPAIWSGRAPLLFPIAGRAEHDLIAVAGHAARMTIHGFAMAADFVPVAQGATFCRHDLCASAATRAIYPRDFRLSVEHRVQEARLSLTVCVENTGTETMPFGLGLHPGFLWPLPGLAGQAHELRLENGAEPAAQALAGGLLTGRALPSPFRGGRLALSEEVFAEDSSLVFAKGTGAALRYGTRAGRGLRLVTEGLPNLVLWHPRGAGFLCIEPWHGLPARLGAGPEIAARPFSVALAPGETRRFSLTIEIDLPL